MQTRNNNILLTTHDRNLLLAYLSGAKGKITFDQKNAAELRGELEKAKLVNEDDFPADVIRINSTVRVKMEGKKEIMEFTLVTPDKADIKEKKVSVLAPVGTALLGFRKGQLVQWQVPSGQKKFKILEVINE